MKILIVGGSGMIGHNFLRSWKSRHDVKVTLRRNLEDYRSYNLFSPTNAFSNIDILKLDLLENLINEFRPDSIVNCVGMTKQLIDKKDVLTPLLVNSVFPHQLFCCE